MKTFFTLLSLLSFTVASAQISENNCQQHISGKVVNKLTGEVLENVMIQVKTKDSLITEFRNQPDGTFSVSLNCKLAYQLAGLKENFTKNIKIVYPKIQGGQTNYVIEMTPYIEFIEVNNIKKIKTEYVDFEIDGVYLTPDITKQLNNIVNLMKKYDKMTIEIGFHTNNDSDNGQYLIDLTQKRADFCTNYLTKNGISSERIKAVGYGFSNPVESCKGDAYAKREKKCTQNKRSEFIVTNSILP